METFKPKAFFINLVLVVLAIVFAGLTWWNSERLIPVEDGIRFPPGSIIVKNKSVENDRETTFQYIAENKISTGEVEQFFLESMREKGWKVKSPKENVLTFSRKDKFARLVIHHERRKTRFTFILKIFK